MKRLLSYSVVMFVITIILLLIIPLPAGLVDVAIILNMSRDRFKFCVNSKN